MDSVEECHHVESILSLSEKRKSLLAILDLPMRSVVTMDGSAIVLQRSDFVGIHSIPNNCFHALMVRGGPCGLSEGASGDIENRTAKPSSTTVGFVQSAGSDNPIFVRQFDRQTEEVSSSPVNTTTETNLRQQFEHDQIDPRRLLAYDQVVSPSQQGVWDRQTKFISRDLLELRGIKNGEKLVPGAYCAFGEDSTAGVDELIPKCIKDGRSVTYPPIPIFPLNAKRHAGTRQFLQSLTPTMRTTVCCDSRTTNAASTIMLEYLLNNVYDQQWEFILGDMQLAFLLFLNLHCYSSWIHWRDLVSLLSTVDRSGMRRYLQLFSLLFSVLSVQIESIEEKDILDGVDVTEEDGFFIPSLQCLLDTTQAVPELQRNESLIRFRTVLLDRFPEHFAASVYEKDFHGCSNNNSPGAIVSHSMTVMYRASNEILPEIQGDFSCSMDDEDSEGPAIVAVEEVEESIARSKKLGTETSALGSPGVGHSRSWLQERYPLLLAAMDGSSYKEDIVMTCARVLYDASDVSLVREAAAYLEEVEANCKITTHC